MSAVVHRIFCFRVALIVFCQDREDGITDDQLRNWHDHVDHSDDNKLSAKELSDFAEQHHRNVSLTKSASLIEHAISHADESGDGFVSLDEHLGAKSSGMRETAEKTRVDETAMFNAADADGDGKLDTGEMQALVVPETHEGVMDLVVSHSLRDADSDNSGKVNLEEFRNSGLAHKGLIQDEDADEAIADAHTLQELDRSTQKVFDRLDTNGDKQVDQNELRDLMSGKIQRENMIQQVVSSLDSDNDKNVDVDELMKGKSYVQDSQIQDYLAEWARRRYHAAPQSQYNV